MSAIRTIWNGAVVGLRWLTIVLFAALVFDVLWGVVARFTPGIIPSDWTEELGIYLLAWVSLLGSALTYRDRGHLGLDYFITQYDPAAQRFSSVIIELCVLVFAGFALCYGGYRLVSDTLASNQLTPVLQWKTGYMYLSVPISGVFFVGFVIEHLLERPVRPEAVEAVPTV
jgi:TRAP-type C4-dicarboxylate transport system permease small subunit